MSSLQGMDTACHACSVAFVRCLLLSRRCVVCVNEMLCFGFVILRKIPVCMAAPCLLFPMCQTKISISAGQTDGSSTTSVLFIGQS